MPNPSEVWPLALGLALSLTLEPCPPCLRRQVGLRDSFLEERVSCF
ncbi:MAG: hypothetical protein ABSF47_01945 [Minisyncoccia bacterium]